MKFLIQRVLEASVEVNSKKIAKINQGLLVYVGIERTDTIDDAKFLLDRVQKLKLFSDNNNKFAYTLKDIKGSLLIVPQFTLNGDIRKGSKPDFTKAMNPDSAEILFTQIKDLLLESEYSSSFGIFRSYMHVKSLNDGPVNFILDSKS